jgi:hypothetical protein
VSSFDASGNTVITFPPDTNLSTKQIYAMCPAEGRALQVGGSSTTGFAMSDIISVSEFNSGRPLRCPPSSDIGVKCFGTDSWDKESKRCMPSFSMKISNCTINVNESTCRTSITYTNAQNKFIDLANITRNIIGSQFLMPLATNSTNTNLRGGISPLVLTHGKNIISAKEDNGPQLGSATPEGKCIDGTEWNNQKCVKKISEDASTFVNRF